MGRGSKQDARKHSPRCGGGREVGARSREGRLVHWFDRVPWSGGVIAPAGGSGLDPGAGQ